MDAASVERPPVGEVFATPMTLPVEPAAAAPAPMTMEPVAPAPIPAPVVAPVVAPYAAAPEGGPYATPVVAPVAAPAPAPGYAPPPPPPPRKKRGCLVTAIVLVVMLAVGCGAIAWLLTRPPRDLGVSYTEADYQSAIAKPDPNAGLYGLGMDVVDTVPEMPVDKTKIVYSGKQERSVANGNPVRLSSKQISAVISMHHRSPKWALSDVQILLGTDNQVQMSGYAVYDGTRYSFYADLNALLAGPKTIGGSADKIVVFGIDFPQQYYSVATQYVVDKTNDWLAGMGEGLDIKSAKIDNGELVLEGTFPTSAKRVPLDSINATGTPAP